MYPECEDSTSDNSNLQSSNITTDNYKSLEELPKNLTDSGTCTSTNTTLCALCWRDFPALHCVFQARILSMVATLKFYLTPDLKLPWRHSSLLAVRATN